MLYLNWFFLLKDFVGDVAVNGEAKEKTLRFVGAEELRTSMIEKTEGLRIT